VLEVARRPRSLTQCNCSICRRYGTLWAYCSRKTARVVAGRRSLVVYRTSPGRRGFFHCRRCGCVMYHQRPGGDGIAVNARTMEPDAVAQCPIRMLDGAGSWQVLETYAQPSLFRSPGR
jgi:hypothetical protein